MKLDLYIRYSAACHILDAVVEKPGTAATITAALRSATHTADAMHIHYQQVGLHYTMDAFVYVSIPNNCVTAFNAIIYRAIKSGTVTYADLRAPDTW